MKTANPEKNTGLTPSQSQNVTVSICKQGPDLACFGMKPDAMIGTPVRYCGQIYVIERASYVGGYEIIRFDSERRVWQGAWIPCDPNFRHWEVVGLWHKKRLRWAILNAERMHPRAKVRSKSARHWRRARAFRGVLRRFFRLIQNR